MILLLMGFKSTAIVATDLFLTIISWLHWKLDIVSEKLGVKIKFHFYDKINVDGVLVFSSAVFLQAIINQVNQNVDRVV